jgi:hypothetical protein
MRVGDSVGDIALFPHLSLYRTSSVRAETYVELLELSCADLHAHIKPHFSDAFEALKTLAETRARWISTKFVAINNEMARRSREWCQALHHETQTHHSIAL